MRFHTIESSLAHKLVGQRVKLVYVPLSANTQGPNLGETYTGIVDSVSRCKGFDHRGIRKDVITLAVDDGRGFRSFRRDRIKELHIE